MKFYNRIVCFLDSFCKLFFKIEVVGLDNIPEEGKVILAANHKSNWDIIFLLSCIGKKRRLTALAKKELEKNFFINYFIKKLDVITINRDNPDISSVKRVFKALKQGLAVIIFPEGTRVKGDNFGEAKQGLAMFALKSKSDIIPISIVTNYRLFSKVTIYIDKPISLEELHGKKVTNEEQLNISQKVMTTIENNYHSFESL